MNEDDPLGCAKGFMFAAPIAIIIWVIIIIGIVVVLK